MFNNNLFDTFAMYFVAIISLCGILKYRKNYFLISFFSIGLVMLYFCIASNYDNVIKLFTVIYTLFMIYIYGNYEKIKVYVNKKLKKNIVTEPDTVILDDITLTNEIEPLLMSNNTIGYKATHLKTGEHFYVYDMQDCLAYGIFKDNVRTNNNNWNRIVNGKTNKNGTIFGYKFQILGFEP